MVSTWNRIFTLNDFISPIVLRVFGLFVSSEYCTSCFAPKSKKQTIQWNECKIEHNCSWGIRPFDLEFYPLQSNWTFSRRRVSCTCSLNPTNTSFSSVCSSSLRCDLRIFFTASLIYYSRASAAEYLSESARRSSLKVEAFYARRGGR